MNYFGRSIFSMAVSLGSFWAVNISGFQNIGPVVILLVFFNRVQTRFIVKTSGIHWGGVCKSGDFNKFRGCVEFLENSSS